MPRLRFLRLGAIQWHFHHGTCSPPYSDEPLFVPLECLLAVHRDAGRRIEELVLEDIVHLDRSGDLAWLESMTAATELVRLS